MPVKKKKSAAKGKKAVPKKAAPAKTKSAKLSTVTKVPVPLAAKKKYTVQPLCFPTNI